MPMPKRPAKCLRRPGDRLDRAPAGAGVELGDRDEQERHDEAHERRDVQLLERERAAVERLDDRDEPDRRQDGCGEHCLVERVDHGVLALAEPGKECADHRRDRRDAAERERQEIQPRAVDAQLGAEQHHCNCSDGVGLEQVRRHACAVADVVADVVCDHGRVARIVLGDPGLELADEVGTDVGCLREDAAAQSGEDGDERATEGKADQVVDRRVRRVVEPGRQKPVVARDAEQAEADDEQARDRPGAERDVQRGREAPASRFGGARVRAHGHVHPDEAGGRGQRGSDQETERRAPAELVVDAEQDERHDCDDRDRRVLLLQVGRSALLDGTRDLPHFLVPGGLSKQPPGQIDPVPHSDAGTDKAEEHRVMHEPIHRFRSLTKSSAEGLRRGRLCITRRGRSYAEAASA
jgi:hypothetical protein